MKKILITGAHSYIGTSFEKWVAQWPDEYQVDTVDMIDGSWREKSFMDYDVVFHVAGIAHIKEIKEDAHLYYEINRDIAVETARKAKSDGVYQFVFLSSMSVYGLTIGVISKDTKPCPKSNYGKSKLEAEQGILSLADDNFAVSVLRLPMVYGKGCKGNYQTLRKIALKFPIFPDVQNKRSMIYIDNLAAFVKSCLDCGRTGILCPQNSNYVCTTDMVKLIVESNRRAIKVSKMLGCIAKPMTHLVGMASKAFGSLWYDDSIAVCESSAVSFEDSIALTEQH